MNLLLSSVSNRSMRTRLSHRSAVSLVITLSQRLSQLGVSILLARILAPSGYGQYVFAMSLVGVAAVFVTQGLSGLLTREVAKSEVHGYWGLLNGLLRRTDQVAWALFGAFVPVLIFIFIFDSHFSGEFRFTLIAAFIFLIFSSLAKLRGARLLGLRRAIAGQLGVSCLQPLLILSAILIAAFIFDSKITPFLAMLFAAGAAAFVYFFNTFLVSIFDPKEARFVPPVYATRRWLKSAVSFSLIGGLFLLNSQVDVLMLGFLSRAQEVGLYRVAVSSAAIIVLVLAAIGPVVGPIFARLHALGDVDSLRRIVRMVAAVSFVSAILVLAIYLFWGRLLLDLVFGENYVDAWLPLLVLTAGQIVNAAVGPVGLVLNMTGYERDSVWVLALSAVLNIILNGLLIPPMGMLGAAIATSVSTIVWNIMLAFRVYARLGFAPIFLTR